MTKSCRLTIRHLLLVAVSPCCRCWPSTFCTKPDIAEAGNATMPHLGGVDGVDKENEDGSMHSKRPPHPLDMLMKYT